MQDHELAAGVAAEGLARGRRIGAPERVEVRVPVAAHAGSEDLSVRFAANLPPTRTSAGRCRRRQAGGAVVDLAGPHLQQALVRAGVDRVDPALAYDTLSWGLLYATNLTLLNYPPARKAPVS
ncbi:MAG: hypothetical protein ACYC1P_03550 [Gaiellaceae bacterium]